MSTTKNTEFKTWDQYVQEAGHAPFELVVSDTETISIPAPTGAALMQWARAYRTGDMEAMLITICGDQWERVEPLVTNAPFKAFEKLVMDIMVFFELPEEHDLVGPSGGTRTERDPRIIRRLIKQGWRPVGEAPSRP